MTFAYDQATANQALHESDQVLRSDRGAGPVVVGFGEEEVMDEQSVLTAEVLEKVLNRFRGEPTFCVIVNMRDWLHTRRTFREGEMRCIRRKRTATFRLYHGLQYVADVAVDLNNRLPLRDGKVFIQHYPEWKLKVEYKPFEFPVSSSFEWRMRFGLLK